MSKITNSTEYVFLIGHAGETDYDHLLDVFITGVDDRPAADIGSYHFWAPKDLDEGLLMLIGRGLAFESWSMDDTVSRLFKVSP